MTLAYHTRRKCFISYHHDDEDEVQHFIQTFDHSRDTLIARGIGASMPGDIINSTNDEYIKSRIREKYLKGTSVTIVLIGRCTWARRFVDWEVAASLRNTSTTPRNGLMAITLPSAADHWNKQLPPRVSDNVDGNFGYAKWWTYPTSSTGLATMIEEAFALRSARSHLVDNSRPLRTYNSSC